MLPLKYLERGTLRLLATSHRNLAPMSFIFLGPDKYSPRFLGLTLNIIPLDSDQQAGQQTVHHFDNHFRISRIGCTSLIWCVNLWCTTCHMDLLETFGFLVNLSYSLLCI